MNLNNPEEKKETEVGNLLKKKCEKRTKINSRKSREKRRQNIQEKR